MRPAIVEVFERIPNKIGPTNLHMIYKKCQANPPMAVPTKKKLVPKAIFLELEILAKIVWARVIVQSIKPLKKRIATLYQYYFEKASKTIHTTFTIQ